MADALEDGVNQATLAQNVTIKHESCENDESQSSCEVENLSCGPGENGNKHEEDDETFKTPPTTFAVPLSLSLSTSTSYHNKKAKNEFGKPPKVKDVLDVKSDNDRGLSPKDIPLKNQTCVSYDEPEWSGETQENYSFDVLKNGTIINNISLKDKSFFIFGRLPSCDVTLEHPSLSRYHAVVQYSKDTSPTSKYGKGWYIYDLDSTHGTWVNKRKVNPKVYQRIKVGHIIKFGGSSRLHILQGPDEDADQESEISITEMKEQKDRQKREAELLHLREKQEEEERAEKERKMLEDKGCGWGMGEDAEDVGDENPFASLTSENENLYIDDPKKALKGFYEREGLDLPDYQFTDVSTGSHKCTLEIPVDGPNGEELTAEAVVSGKKKDAVVACALEACRMLDKLGMLRSSTHESRKRKERNWEDNDFYDSDEDTFLDRTGTIEKKRTMRMKKAGKESAETYESLMMKHSKVTERIHDIEKKLEKAKADSEALANQEMDELEAYMISIKSGVMDSKTRLHLKGELLRLKMEEQSLRRLVNIAKPASLPPLKPLVSATSGEKVSTTESLSRKLQQLQKQKQSQKKGLPVKHTVANVQPDDYEEEDDDDDDRGKKTHFLKTSKTSKPELSQTQGDERKKSDEVSHKRFSEKESRPSIKKQLPESPKEEIEHTKSTKPSKYFSTSSALETIDKHRSSSKHPPASESRSQVDLDTLDPKFATWLPPKEQTGDGRTSLNDKFGY